MKIILAGSEGLIGRAIQNGTLPWEHELICLDKRLGHDLTNPVDVGRLMRLHSDAQGLCNLFALNPQPGDDQGMPGPASFDEYCRVNGTALYDVCLQFSQTRPCGVIVNFASLYGLVAPDPRIYPQGTVKHPGYVFTKHGVVGLTKWLAVYLAKRFRVNCVAPGGIRADQDEGFVTEYARRVPMGRMMRPEEIEGPVRFLLSNGASYMTGATLVVDGGATCW